MTVVAGMISVSGWGYIGADIAATNGDLLSLTLTPKVTRVGTTLVGYAGSFQQGARAFRQMERMTNRSIVRQFERSWRKDDYQDTDFLFIEQGRIFEMQGADGSVLECVTTSDETAYAAIGGGAAVALGALFVERIDITSLLNALNAAEAHVPGIRGPMVIIEQPPT
jgi:hypothetical protein